MTRGDGVYRTYGTYLRETYGAKVYKVPLSIPSGCPNRDGLIAVGGCAFCSEKGGSEEEGPPGDLRERFLTTAAMLRERYGAEAFLAYFQRFSNTYVEPEILDEALKALDDLPVVGVVLGTRPDCLSDEIFAVMDRWRGRFAFTLELGLQTVNYRTLAAINRGHGLADFIDGAIRARDRGYRCCAHFILNLPGDEDVDAVEGAKIINALGVEEVKLHALYIAEGTVLGRAYAQGAITLGTEEAYRERVILFLRHLNPDVVVQRLIGRAPEEGSLFVNWGRSWWAVQEAIVETMRQRGHRQGDLWTGPKKLCKKPGNSI